MFKVECVGCQAPYQVDERRVPDKGLKMRCPKCGTTFKVEPPAPGAATGSAPPAEPEPPIATAAPKPQPFTSAGAEPGLKLGKAPGSRDSLARTMIGVSSSDMELIGKEPAAEPNKPKAFRIPRPGGALPEREPAAPPAPAASALELDLPATAARARPLGLTTRGLSDVDAALPAVVPAARRGGVAMPEEVKVVLPSAAPASDPAWLAGDEVADAPASAGQSAPLRISELPQPVAAPPRGAPSDLPQRPAPVELRAAEKAAPLELELEEDLPIVATGIKRPPPRRHRAPQVELTEEEADLPARLDDLAAPVPAAPPRAPRPPSRQKSSSLDELDLPAVAPRVPAAPAQARSPFADKPPVDKPPPAAAPTLVDLPSAQRARPAVKGLSDVDLPAIGRGSPGAGASPARAPAPPPAPAPLPSVFGGSAARAPTVSDLPGVRGNEGSASDSDLPGVFGGATARGAAHSDLPGVLGGAAPARGAAHSDLPGVLGGAAPARGAAHSDLPGVLGGAAPARGAAHSDLPGVLGGAAPARGAAHSDLPGVLGGEGHVRAAPDSDLPGVFGGAPSAEVVGLPRASAASLPDVHASQRGKLGRATVPDMRVGDLPALAGAGLPDVLSVDLPDFHDTGLPEVLGSGLPEVAGAGLPDVLSAGLPAVSDVALPEVLAPGVSSFGRIDLPVARPAELPDVRGRMGFDEVDLPGVGESLPTVAGAWGEANLPLVGESLPMHKGRASGAQAFDGETPFGAFDPAEGDPFAGSEAEFGTPDSPDPFGAPGGDEDEFAPAEARAGGQGSHAHAGGAGYGEVDIGSTEGGDSALETADDGMEFEAIPQHDSAPAGRAAAHASVHTDNFDGDAAGSTLELGPERKAPKQRRRQMVAMAAIGLSAIAGGALALVPAVGPFGIHFVVDQIKRGEHERLAAKLVGDTREAESRDTLSALQGPLKALAQAHDVAPRFEPLSLRSAIHHYKAVLRYGPLPNAETTAKVALDQVDPDSDDSLVRLARAARSAIAHGADAKAQLEALGADIDARQLLGELALHEQDWAGASNVWSALAKSQPDSARAAFGVARAALGLGKLSEAMTEARHVLALNPEHVGAPILMLEAQRGLLQENAEKAAAADSTEQLAAAVARVLPNASPGEAALAHCVLGELHSSQGRAQPAQQEFEAALIIDRSLPRALIGLGEVLHLAGRHTEALARFEAAAHAEPKSLPALLGIAKSQIELAHLKEAKAVLAQLSESHKDQPDVIFWTAKAEQALGENDAAIATYRAAIVAAKGKPSSIDSYLSLAKLQAELGQLALAQDTLSEARAKLPPSGPLHKALGEIALSRAEYSKAYEYFQKALELEADDTRARFLGAVALTRMGRFEEALRAFQTVSDTDKDFPGLAVERGRLFEESGRNAEALAEYESALKKTPDDPDVQIRVGCSRVVAGQAAAAQELLEKAIKVRTRSAEASYCLGRSLFEQERYTDAMVRLERAIGIDPTRAIYYQYAGWVAAEIGRQGDAQNDFDKAIELDKGLADAYWLRGRLRLKQGAAKDAIVDLEHARELKPSRFDALGDLAVAYADTGRMPKALDMWEEAIASDPDNPTWHFRYGKLLSSAGNGAMAAAHLKRAVDLVAEADHAAAGGAKPKPPLWLWQAHYLLGRELGMVAAAIPHWQAYLRLSPRDDPYRPEAERALRDLGQPWVQR
jgi:predicted Zn finger-like uncharacterized protein